MKTIALKKPLVPAKTAAHASLTIMAAGFISTLAAAPDTWAAVLHGGFEAGLVGGLADWFAVTALFKHPLGLPIPHTALLMKNRKKLTEALLKSVEQDWLKKENIHQRIQKLPIGEKAKKSVAVWLRSPMGQRLAANHLAQAASWLPERLGPKAEQLAQDMIRNVSIEKITPAVIDAALAQKSEEMLWNAACRALEAKWAEPGAKEAVTDWAIGAMENKAKHPLLKMAFKPLVSAGKDQLAAALHKGIDETLSEWKRPGSKQREEALEWIRAQAEKMKTDAAFREALEKGRTALIKGTVIQQASERALREACRWAEKEAEPLAAELMNQAAAFLETSEAGEKWAKAGDQAGKQLLGRFVDTHHTHIGEMVRENLDRLDSAQLVDMLEEKIGKELSWIRINGALCGFGIGLVLTGIGVML